MDLTKIIREGAFYHCYQPLYDLANGGIWAYEALLRTHIGLSPDKLFYAARRENQLYALDTLSIERAIDRFLSRNIGNKLLFVNIFPSTIQNRQFSSFINRLQSRVDVTRIVLEINEAHSEKELWDSDILEERLIDLKQRGIRIALDDISAGANGLQLLVRVNPDIVKLDKYFAGGFELQHKKLKMIAMLTEFCHPETKVVLEGIETVEALDTAKSSKVDYGQGYLLGKPMTLEEIEQE